MVFKIEEQFNKHPMRTITLSMLTAFAIYTGVWEAYLVPKTGYWTFKKQEEYLKNRNEKAKKEYDELHKEFLLNVDRDQNGYIDFAEQVDAWRRMGDEGPFFESKGALQFSDPTLEDLEKAVKSYKKE